jgi:hypothetical protein
MELYLIYIPKGDSPPTAEGDGQVAFGWAVTDLSSGNYREGGTTH